MSLFLPITKVDSERRLVYGTLSEEVRDKSDEILDYATAKPAFEKWSNDIKEASGGKSLGNVRAMHGAVAAGKLTELHFDDDAKRIDGVAKIIDDAEWKKVVEGVYTGFSIGGGYARRWVDPSNANLMRYTPTLAEVSIVDNPCVPTATFEYIKEDGSVEMRKFTPSHKEDSMTTANSGGAAAADNAQPDAGAALAKTELVKDGKAVKPKSAPMQKWLAEDGQTFDSKREAEIHNLGLEKQAELAPGLEAMNALLKGEKKPVDEDEDEEGDDEDTKKAKKARRDEKAAKSKEDTKKDDTEIAAKSDEAGDPDVKAGESKDGKQKVNPKDGQKAADSEDEPKDKKEDKKKAKKDKSEKSAAPSTLEKGLHQVGWLASLLSELTYFQDSVEIEQYFEDDKDSELPMKLKSLVTEMCELLVTLVEEETSELTEGDDTDVEVLEMAAGLPAGHAGAIAKAVRAEAEPLSKSDSKAESATGAKLVKFAEILEKAGARHSKADTDRVQKLHDHAEEMHKCMGDMVDKCAKMTKMAGESKNTAIDLGAEGEHVDDEENEAQSAGSGAKKMSKALAELNAKNDELLVVTKLAASQNETLLKAIPVIEDLQAKNAELVKRMEHLEGQPLPAKGHVRAVSKAQDNGATGNGNAVAEFEAALEKMTPEQQAMAVMKASLRNPLSKI